MNSINQKIQAFIHYIKKKQWDVYILDFIKTVAVSLLLVFLVTQFLLKPIEVIGDSMYPTLKDKQIGFANVIGLKLLGVDRFDVVIVYMPEIKDYYVKRVIGLPYETIEFKNDVLFVDGEPQDEYFLDEKYVSDYKKAQKTLFTANFGPITLKENEYFVMGDNRPKSRDSRYFGAISKSQLISKDAYIIFPLHQFQLIFQ